ncbi:DUF2802 domain-containing protein [Thalassotalea agariperforans]
MPSIVVALLIVVLLVFAITVLYIIRLSKKINVLEEQSANLTLVLDNQQMNDVQQHELLASIQETLQAPILENEQVTKQLTVRTKHIQEKLAELETELEKLKHEQPEDKLYRRALKMVELGADIEEIIAECDIPRAEAELLFSIHLKE